MTKIRIKTKTKNSVYSISIYLPPLAVRDSEAVRRATKQLERLLRASEGEVRASGRRVVVVLLVVTSHVNQHL